jgi:hypothetical protein
LGKGAGGRNINEKYKTRQNNFPGHIIFDVEIKQTKGNGRSKEEIPKDSKYDPSIYEVNCSWYDFTFEQTYF